MQSKLFPQCRAGGEPQGERRRQRRRKETTGEEKGEKRVNLISDASVKQLQLNSADKLLKALLRDSQNC